MQTPRKMHIASSQGWQAPVRGGLVFLVSLLALLLAASLVSAQPPDKPPAKPSQDPGVHGGFSRHGEPGRSSEKPFDPTGARRVTWIDPQGGSWNEPSKWSGGALPGEDEVAVIALEGTYEVTLDADAVVGGLELGGETGVRTLVLHRHTLKIRGASHVGDRGVLHLDGGIVTGPGDLEIAGRLQWSAGSMSGTGTLRIAPSGHLSLEGAQRKVLSLRPLENAGKAEWSGTGEWVLTFDAPVRNLEGGEWVLAADALLDVYGPPGPVFENAGTLRKRTSGTVTFEPPLRNTGRVEVEQGALELTAGFAQTAGATEVVAGAAIRAPGGFDIAGGTVSGKGSYPHPAPMP